MLSRFAYRLYSNHERFTLRPYQEECIQACLKAFHDEKITRQAVSLPVGSGKTMIFSNLISRLTVSNPKATKSLVLAHREELLEQACRMIERVSPGVRVGIEQGRSRADPDQLDVIVASVPTLGRKDSNRLSKYNPALFKCIVIDEAHHAPAESYMRIIEHFRVNPSLLIWGCSATLSRNDHLALGLVFDKIVYHTDVIRLMREGHLCPLQIAQIETDIDLTKVEQSALDFDAEQLSLAIDTPVRNKLIVDTWLNTAWTEQKRRSTIAFGLNVKHVENLAQEFYSRGVCDPAVLTGKTSDVIRREIMDLFSNGKLGVLLNCAVLTEGTDLPRTDCVLLTRPTCNSNMYIQMVGRGLRKHPEKEYCLLIDVVDRVSDMKRSLITFPTLLPKHECSEGEEVVGEALTTEKKEKIVTDAMMDKIRVKVTQSDSSQSIIALGGHRIAWVQVDRTTLIAADIECSFLLSLDEPILEKLSCSITIFRSKLKESQVFTLPGTPLHFALEALAMHLSNTPRQLQRMSRNAHWRSHPISSGQLRYLTRIAEQYGQGLAAVGELHKWSVGRASDVLTKYIFMKTFKKPIASWNHLIDGVQSVSIFKRHS